MPGTFPWGPFCVRVRAVAHTVMHFRSERRKGQKTRVERRREGERERKREASTYAWQKINASCALTPRGFFRATRYRPVERSNGRATRTSVNVLSGGSSSLLFFSFFFFKHLFLRVPSCACITCSISFARVFDYGCLMLRHRARATYASATAPPDREASTTSSMHPPVAYHVSHILIQKTLAHTY